MITVEEAKRFVIEAAPLAAVSTMGLHACTGLRLARNVTAPHDHPLFGMSAVDGYAFASGTGHTAWKVVAELAAGDVHQGVLRPDECVRILTGAMVPEGADTVVMQEFVRREGHTITHSDTRLKPGANVRRKGEQVKAGEVLLKAGALLGPAEVGLLASAGVMEVPVHARPTVSIVRTGGEFADGPDAVPGKIFSSNERMLSAALATEGIATEHRVFSPRDERDELRLSLMMAMDSSDVVITTGGVSVGDHDLVRECLEKLGAEILFHGVEQKPGKPMLFARMGHTHVFGLPGNPRAVLVAWWEYVLPFLQASCGATDPWLRSDILPLSHAVITKGDRSEFRAAQVKGGQATLLRDEGSHMLASLIGADALAYLPAQRREWKAGDPMEVHYLPR